MPVSRAFLKPRSVESPPQGDFEFIPEVTGFEEDSMAELLTAINTGVGIQQEDLENYFVVESVEYQTTVYRQELGMNPAVVKYSALVWYTRVHRV